MLELIWPSICAGCEISHQGRLCPQCAPTTATPLSRPPPGIRDGWSLAPYQSPLGRALGVAKYRPDRQLLSVLGERMAEVLAPTLAPLSLQAIVPAPSPWTTRLSRGFASASVLAAALSRRTGLPVRDALRVSPGTRQAALSGGARRENLGGRVRGRLSVPGRVLLIDDVLTTGATADACARELLGDRSEGVWLAVLCLAGDDRPQRGGTEGGAAAP